MKGKNSLFGPINKNIASGNISFMGDIPMYSNFSKYIANRSDIDPNGMFDVIAHGNATQIQIVNKGIPTAIDARTAAKLIRKDPNFHKSKSVRLLSCDTGSIKSGFAQHLANALGKPVYAPNKTIYANIKGNYWIADKKGARGDFIKFIPGGYRHGK